MGRGMRWTRRGLALAALTVTMPAAPAVAQTPTPTLEDPDLAVRPAATGLNQPVSMAFIDKDEFLVLEKATGQVKWFRDGMLKATVLDLAVNSASERGLLGIALHPKFRKNGWVYLFWSQSKSGADTTTLDDVRLMGNRIDRFEWERGGLEFDRNIIKFRAFQADAGQPLRANHDGGVLRFGPDSKLYAIVGDTGRRGQTQNLVNGPFTPPAGDDQFGGPEPDDLHRTGVIVRLDDDGDAPRDNPFWRAGRQMGGEVGENVQKLFAYGIRNSFGLAFDRRSGNLWEQENGDDSFSEINRVRPGMNGGWVQIMGPVSRIGQYKAIETDPTAPQPLTPAGYFGLQQIRWLPTNIADSPAEALARLFTLPGSHYSDPEFSWKFEVAPGGIGFLDSRDLGRRYKGDLFVGGARDFLEGGHLFRLDLTRDRRDIQTRDPRLADSVADNLHKWEITESESLLFGRNFGVGTDIQTGPDGELYVVSLSHGNVYEIHRR
ncbi:MAG TPA: PQQ-dependent sugar dehydrogenase [Solirubrobacteraceae bacterium]|nr:PQQ-dependent sugar dehydrogenase [Solirubrobacteraceae bacterium]